MIINAAKVFLLSASLASATASAQIDNLPQCSDSRDMREQVQATRLVAAAASSAMEQAAGASVNCRNMLKAYEQSIIPKADQRADQAMAGHPAGAGLMGSACNSYRLVAGNLKAMGCSR